MDMTAKLFNSENYSVRLGLILNIRHFKYYNMLYQWMNKMLTF